MIEDINKKAIKKNAFRATKDKKLTALRVRVPGGKIEADTILKIGDIAKKYGNGKIHITTRQGFEILGIPWNNMQKCNEEIQYVIDALDINQGIPMHGYSASGTRNIAACIGNEVCPKAQYDTTAFAKKIEKSVFPNDLHFKIALTGCPNDCQKVRMHDFGIIGQAKTNFLSERCISCGRCEKICTKVSTGAIDMVNKQPLKNKELCIGCGECVLNCPAGAWQRDEKKYYRLTLLGRTGKKNPRLAEDFILWCDEKSIIKIIKNTYDFVEKYIDRSLDKEHIGYIVDRTGFEEFKSWALKDVELPVNATVMNDISWSGIEYKKSKKAYPKIGIEN